MTVKTDTKIINGSRFTNTVTVDGEKRTSTAVKSASGGGTGSGDTVGHIGVKKAVTNGNVPGDTVFPVTWTYEYDGETHTGELPLRADGVVETLNNVPDGVVVTLTERVPSVAGFDFGDPVFSGAGVSDGVPDSNNAKVRVEGMNRSVFFGIGTIVNPGFPGPWDSSSRGQLERVSRGSRTRFRGSPSAFPAVPERKPRGRPSRGRPPR